MPMQPSEIDDLKGLIAKARQREVNFGLSLGKKPDGTVLYLDIKKPPAVLQRNAKKEGETPKVACGTCTVSGKVLTLTCEAEVPAGATKMLRKFFVEIGMPMKVIALDQNGNAADVDDEDDATPEAGQARPGADAAPVGNDTDARNDEPDPLADRWQQIEAALDPAIQAFAGADPAKGPAVAKAWAGARSAAEKGDYKGALAVAAKLKQVVDAGSQGGAQPAAAPASEPADNPDAAKWHSLADKLAALYTKAMATNPANRTQLEAAYMMAVEKAEGGDYRTALTIAARITPALQKAATAATTGTEAEIPKDVVPFQKSRVLWAGTRQTMFSELAKLQNAIRSTIGDDPDLAEVLDEVGSLTDRLSAFDDRLEDVLDRITNSAPGAERDALKKEALGVLAAYQDALKDDFFGDVDQGNGFVNVAITSTASKSLDTISKVLAA